MADDRPAAQVWTCADGSYVARCGLCDFDDRPYNTAEDAGEVARLHAEEEHPDD